MKLWEPHDCKCGVRLVHLMGAPHFGIVWGSNQQDMKAVLVDGGVPEHDVYVYKGEDEKYIMGKCRK